MVGFHFTHSNDKNLSAILVLSQRKECPRFKHVFRELKQHTQQKLISSCPAITLIKLLLTVKPLRIIFQRSLEVKLLLSRTKIVQIIAKYDWICFREFCIGSRVESGQATRVACRHPHGSTVVCRVVRTLRHP